MNILRNAKLQRTCVGSEPSATDCSLFSGALTFSSNKSTPST